MRFDLFTIPTLGSDTPLSLETNYFLSPENQLVQNHHRFRPKMENLCCFCYFKCFLPCCVGRRFFSFNPTCSYYIGRFFGESQPTKEEIYKLTTNPFMARHSTRHVTTMTHMFFTWSCFRQCVCVCEECSVSKEWRRGWKKLEEVEKITTIAEICANQL